MNRLFVEVQAFRSGWLKCGLTDADLIDFQSQLLNNPDAGPVIPHTGGIRKVRFGIGDQGKRGGARIIYIDFPECGTLFLLYAYGKHEQENITEAEKKKLKKYAEQIEAALKARGNNK